MSYTLVMINVVIALGNLCMSQGLGRLLASDENVRSHAVGAHCLLSTVREMHPDVILVDFFVLNNHLPYLEEETKVMLFDTGCGEDNIFYALIAKNISGVIGKDADGSQLGKAIESVFRGDLWLDRKTIRSLLLRLSALAELWRLTELETNMLHLISKGTSTMIMADTLGLSLEDISAHLDLLKNKTGIKDRLDLLALLIQFDKYDMP